MSQANEREILRAVMDYLTAKRVLAFRMNSGTLPGRLGKPVSFGVAGMADVLAFPSYTKRRLGEEFGEDFATFTWIEPTWLECKTATGKQSELQKSFQAQVEAEGHRYALIRSIEDLEEALK